MVRKKLTDRQWDRIAPLLPGKPTDPGRTGADTRNTVEGILYVARTGCPWRDLPAQFGKWGTVYQRFRRWQIAGVFDRIFKATKLSLNVRTVQVDGTYVKVHQHAAGAPKEVAHRMNRGDGKPLGGVAVG